ncbi:MAG: hypothetical protein ABII12_12410 [Planctomycetota bacterium]
MLTGRLPCFNRWKRCLIPASFLCGISLCLATGCGGPTWYLDARFAQRLAKQENKPLLLYFKDWDSNQHRDMQEKVFKNAEVVREMKTTINVELEFNWAGTYATQYDVRKSHMCVMCDPQSRAVGEALFVNPVPKPEDFLRWLRRQKEIAVPPKEATSTPVSAVPAPHR